MFLARLFSYLVKTETNRQFNFVVHTVESKTYLSFIALLSLWEILAILNRQLFYRLSFIVVCSMTRELQLFDNLDFLIKVCVFNPDYRNGSQYLSKL